MRFAFSGDSRKSYQPLMILDSTRLAKPDFFVHLGDTVYGDRNWRATELDQFWSKCKTNREDPPTRRLLAETGLYVIWRDHEVENNYFIQERAKDRRLNCPVVFQQDGDRIGEFRKSWKRACKLSDLDGVTVHDLRRCAARNLSRAGVPEAVAMEITGHKTRSMYRRYRGPFTR